MTCIMHVSIYTCWVRFKNISTKISKWLGIIFVGERLRSLNRCQYHIDICAKVDTSMCKKNDCYS